MAHKENGKIVLEEIYRFSNEMRSFFGEKRWDADRLFKEIKKGMKKCKKLGKIPVSMGIDTWAVDFALLDKDGMLKSYEVVSEDSTVFFSPSSSVTVTR